METRDRTPWNPWKTCNFCRYFNGEYCVPSENGEYCDGYSLFAPNASSIVAKSKELSISVYDTLLCISMENDISMLDQINRYIVKGE